jgi:hypothetical protein
VTPDLYVAASTSSESSGSTSISNALAKPSCTIGTDMKLAMGLQRKRSAWGVYWQGRRAGAVNDSDAGTWLPVVIVISQFSVGMGGACSFCIMSDAGIGSGGKKANLL